MYPREPNRPTPETVDEAFKRLVRLGRNPDKCGRAGRRLYIFFSGHGSSPDLEPDEAALLMANAARDVPGYHVPGRLYANSLLVEAPFDEIVPLMDCCRDDDSRVARRPPAWVAYPSAKGSTVRKFYAFATRWGRQALADFHRGSLTAAAREIDVPDSALGRLARGRAGRIRLDTLARLTGLFPRAPSSAIAAL
jgi:hypothetical protein